MAHASPIVSTPLSCEKDHTMIYAKRAARFLEQLASPDDQSFAPQGVLLYSPSLLRLVAVCAYGVFVLGFINNYFLSDFFNRWFSDEKMTRLFYTQSALVIVGAIGTGSVVIFARSRYRGCMLGATMLAISSSMIACSYMYGYDVNPHLLLAITPLLLVGFTVGRDGLLLSAGWIGVNYLFLYLADTWGWWPQLSSIGVDVVKHENLSAFIILILIVLATQFYLVKISATLRKQGELHREVEARQRAQLELLSRLVSSKDEERKRIARDLHDAPLQEMAVISRALTEMREDVEGMLARCEDVLLTSEPKTTASERETVVSPASPVTSLMNEWHTRLSRLLGEDLRLTAVPLATSDVGSSLTTMDQPTQQAQESIPTIEATLTQVRATSQSIRDICDDLHPTYLDDPLASTLSASVSRLRAQSPTIPVTLTTSGSEPPELPDETKTACKHILEEAVSNALAHAHATSIECSLSFALDGLLTLEVADDGIGFESRPARELRSAGHHGLANMRERAELVGGELSIEAQPGMGTLIKLLIRSQVFVAT